jgi:putative ABC transport system ATP-binding protein
MKAILKVEDLTMKYRSGEGSLIVLDHISFSVHPGEIIAITGPSGSGKTTLLGLCAGLDRPTSGNIYIGESLINILSEDERAVLRNQNTGFIFQNFQLIPSLTALENVMIPMELMGMHHISEKAKHLLKRVGLENRMRHYPAQLSGGEQQRVALARAFSNHPKILFADEPTGNLDGDNAEIIQQLMFELNKEHNTTLIIVTHDPELAAKTGRILKLKSGKLISDLKVSSENVSASNE